MRTDSLSQHLAICSWSLQPTNPQNLIDHLLTAGVRRVQLALDPLREHAETWKSTDKQMQEKGIEIVSGMVGCMGEDYSTLETIRATGGIAPDNTWEQNLNNFRAAAETAKKFGLKLVTFHAGFLPHNPTDKNFAKLQQRLKQTADLFHEHGISLALETGQETAVTLREFLLKLDHPGVGVNFDPANMILYDKGNPIEAMQTLGPWIQQVHIKDARRTKTPGTWGDEVVVGTGEVDWPAFFHVLSKINFSGDCCIEREAGNQRLNDIQTAIRFIKEITK